VVGSGTTFSSHLKVGDYIGNTTSGYRKITEITDDENLKVSAAFDVALDNSSFKRTNIRKGFTKNLNLTEVGAAMRLAFITAAESDVDCPSQKVRAGYGFYIVIEFSDPDPDTAEDRIGSYDKAIRDCVDNDPTFGDNSIRGTTDTGQLKYAENPFSDGLYYGIIPFIVEAYEVRGNR
jgi:hypothetical protein